MSKAEASVLDKFTTIVAKALVKASHKKNNDRNKIFYDFKSILEDRKSIEKIKGNNELNDIVPVKPR